MDINGPAAIQLTGAILFLALVTAVIACGMATLSCLIYSKVKRKIRGE